MAQNLPSDRAEAFSEEWRPTISACCRSLEPRDHIRIAENTTADEVQVLLQTKHDSTLPPDVLQEWALLARALDTLKEFLEFVSKVTNPEIDDSAFWGSVALVVQLSQTEDGIATGVPRSLRMICHRIDILHEHAKTQTTATALAKVVKGLCFDAAHSLLLFMFRVIRFIREDGERSSDITAWKSTDDAATTLASSIDGMVSGLEKMSKISELENLRQLQSTSAEVASLPCFLYPTFKTHRFFGRTEEISRLDRFFNAASGDGAQTFRSIALHGIGGVGKSSVALRYAEILIELGELDAMFWVASDKEVAIRQSFTDVAIRLKLPEAQTKDHDQNRTAVLDWLRNTACRWLVVYDNVESPDLLTTYWPMASRGRAIVTTRDRIFASAPTNGGLELTQWDAETGSRFLLHLLSTTIASQMTSEEADSAHDLSNTLSGHALELSLTAGLIHRRSWTIAEFVEMYRERPGRAHSVSRNSLVGAMWDMSFRSLSEKSRGILGVLSFIAPDSVPQGLFEVDNRSILPGSRLSCDDPLDFSEEIETLSTLALIKCNKEQRTLSVHRLVQTSFRAFLSPAERQKSFNDATQLVSAAFPRKDSEFAQMYQLWEPCSLYLPHVLSLKDSFLHEKKANPNFSALPIYVDLNNACQRFLIETNGYNDLLDLTEFNATALATIQPQPHHTQVDLEGSLASHRGQVLARVGSTDQGVRELRLAYDLFATDEPRNLCEEAWCAENLADGIASSNRFPEAIEWQEKARKAWLEWAKDNSEDKHEWPAILKWGMGTNLVWAGQTRRSREVLTQALEQIETAKPYNWAMAAYIHYSLGTVERSDGNLEPAEMHFTEAHNKWLSGDNLRSDPFSGACVYRMGCVALDQGKVESAIKYLREASVITERHLVKMPVEHARTLFKLSEALAQDPRSEEQSMNLRDEAECLLRSRQPQILTRITEAQLARLGKEESDSFETE